MKVHIQGEEHNFRLALPTALMVRLILQSAKISGTKVKGLSRRQAAALRAELRRIKKDHGSWTLVGVRSSDGETVTVTL